MILGARHVGFVVSNLPHSKAFYEGLGFRSEGSANTETGEKTSTLVGVADVVIHTLKLSLSESEEGIWREGGFRIELIEYVTPLSNRATLNNNNFIGRGHLCFTVNSIPEVVEKALSLGGTAPFSPVLDESGLPGAIYILDPDGIPIELSKNRKYGVL